MKRLLVLLLTFAQVAVAAVSHVRGTSNFTHDGTAATTCNMTLPATPSVGDVVIVTLSMYSTSSTAPSSLSVKDGNSNTYAITTHSPATGQFGATGGNNYAWLYTAYFVATGTPSATINTSWTTSKAVTCWADEFTGGTFTYDKDAAGTIQVATGTLANSPSITPTNSNALLYSVAIDTYNSLVAPTAGSTSLAPWIGSTGGLETTNSGSGSEYDLSASGSTALNYTTGAASDQYIAMVAAFNTGSATVTVANPTFSLSAGTYSSGLPQSTTVATSTSGATLCITTCTTSGCTPTTPAASTAGTCSTGTQYNSNSQVLTLPTGYETISALGTEVGDVNSAVSTSGQYQSVLSWAAWNGRVVSGISSMNGTTIGQSTGNYGQWNGLVAPVGAPGSVPWPGWTYLQDTFYNPGCSMGSTTCTMAILPTTAGSVWAIQTVTGSNTMITAANGWTLCPASSCHIYTGATGAQNMDAAYRIGGPAGTTSVTVTMSTAPTGFWGFAFLELLPPAGYTASFDTSGSVIATACTVCTAVPLSLSGTDAIVQFQIEQNNPGNQGWNGWSAPYITDTVNNGIYLNATSGAAPTLTQNVSGVLGFSALAFKSSAGAFTAPTPSPLFSIYSQTPATNAGVSCSPTCSLTIPTTQAGDLLFAHIGNTTTGKVSSVSGGGTWVVPTAANTCQAYYSGAGTDSCAYVLSSTSGTTSISFTMSASGTYGIDVYEIQRSSGSFALDTQASSTLVNSTNDSFGPALSLTGTNDVIFQEITGVGFFNNVLYYPQPYIPTASGFDVFYYTGSSGSSTAVLTNTTNGAAAQWLPQSTGASIVLTAIAFK